MTPYYEQDGIVIYHGDCREILPTLPRECGELIVTDPPYGVSWRSNSRRLQFDAIANDETVDAGIAGVRLALPLITAYRHVYVFGPFDLSGVLESIVELIWDKGSQSGGDLELPWGSEHEHIQFGIYVPAGWTTAKAKGRLAARIRKGSVLNVPRLNATAVQDHPTEKPVPLLRELIESSSCIGETVIDPFMGVGTTLQAAQLEGRKAIGIEVEEKYCEIAANRLARASRLFGEATA